MFHSETIVAISTPPGQGGVGMVRLSGHCAVPISREIFHCTPLLGERVRHVEYGRVVAQGREIDTGLAWFLQAPRSYTGEDTVEISCHGSTQVLESLVQAAICAGATLAAPGEFTRRAFLNGHLDLLQAEAVIDLIQASSQSGLETAYGHASGRLSRLVKGLEEAVVDAITLLEIGLDFSEEDLETIQRERLVGRLQQSRTLAGRLVETFTGSRHRQAGYLIALVGRPNVGKSTLFNALLGEDRAIVTPVPGTTRDVVEGRVFWGGELVRLVDTAGLRLSGEEVEVEGIRRARKTAEMADFILAILDSSAEWSDEELAIFELLRQRPGIAVFNKTDLPRKMTVPLPLATEFPQVEISALSGNGIEKLQECVQQWMPRPNLVDGLAITRQRHHDCLVRVVQHLERSLEMIAAHELEECIIAELREALQALGQILGEDIDDAVLDHIFSAFCIGK